MLHLCFIVRWPHADKLGTGNLEEVGYVFLSPLHCWFAEWELFNTFEGRPAVPFEPLSILTFVLDVISKFSPRFLSDERRIGPGYVQRPISGRILPLLSYSFKWLACRFS